VLPQGAELLTAASPPSIEKERRRSARRGLTLRSFVIGIPLACLLFVLLLVGVGAALRPDLSAPPRRPPEPEVAAAQQARDVHFDASRPDSLPRFEKPIDPAHALDAPWWPKGESPILAQLVNEGKLPPVAERVGPQPVVLDGATGAPPDGSSVGKYGGTWLHAATSAYDVFTVEFRMGYSSLFRWSPLGYPIVPHLALSVDESDDRKEYVVHLRPGVHWSDGAPFGADDILFWWYYDEIDTVLGDGAPPVWLQSGTGQTRLEKIDDLTFKVSFDEPFGNFMEVMAANSYFMTRFPKHYFEKYHPALADKAFLAREMKALDITSPLSLWKDRLQRWDNPECPRLWPWIPRSSSESAPFIYTRNPYYFAVDPQGNQLPYIDRIQFDLKTSQVLPLTFTNGEVTMQGRHVSYENYTELMSRQQEAHYRLLHWYSATRSTWLIDPNLTRYIDPAQPSTAKKAKLLADKRFRQALSLAIDRQAIIHSRFDDTVRAAQVEPGKESPFHNERLASAFIEHDPARANALLDELGLTHRDLDGLRTFEDGSTMTFYLMFAAYPGMGPAEFVVDDWREVGLRVIAKEHSRALFQQKRDSSDFDLVAWMSESDYFPLLEPRQFAPPDTEALYATAWGRWFTRGGYFGSPQALAQKNGYPPPLEHPMYAAYRSLVEARQFGTLEERAARFREATDIAAENLWTINIAEAPPFLVVVKDGLHNVPTKAMYTSRTPGNTGNETFYFENPSHAADAATRDAIEHLVPLPRQAGAAPVAAAPALTPGGSAAGPNQQLGKIIRWSLIGIGGLLLLLLSIRHPFVARRILVLIPTLAIVSVVVFAAIDLPPGDYLSTRVVALSEMGDSNSLSQLEELRQRFHFDDPAWKRYLRWMGVEWFTTHDSEDLGLLQGFLGRSMETGRPVNDLVGDRIVLTVLISLATILFTWMVALPIGIYSAVRQYSLGDYLFSFIGFLGMSLPPFLLALVLMVVAGVSGLFSPEFASQAGWTMPKVIDLLKHVWIPVLVMGVSGTAGLARVLRANLLDELKKPYVTTARARGVRPLKLLFKYPVRVALNPFVSGLGGLFPQLVSGGAIVGIVLSLPLVGPLQIEALVNEDTYLAGSMLMVLSLLSVFGTLVADVLLLWLDPRIRYEKGVA
jgi:ABC-type dipeptide/oligopeptide/nickel transport system permease component/ABC-type transport system substrate-binding protein